MEDRLGKAEREDAAVAMYGEWRGRTRSVVLLVFCLAGALAGIVGYILVRELQLRMTHINIVYISGFVGFVGPFMGLAVTGRLVSNRVLRRRTPDAIRRIAALYQIEPGVLAETA